MEMKGDGILTLGVSLILYPGTFVSEPGSPCGGYPSPSLLFLRLWPFLYLFVEPPW